METTLTSLDLYWFLLSTVSIALLSLLAWLAKRILDKMNLIDRTLGSVMVAQATLTQELHDHIGNEGVHCKDGDCLYRRRVGDEI